MGSARNAPKNSILIISSPARTGRNHKIYHRGTEDTEALAFFAGAGDGAPAKPLIPAGGFCIEERRVNHRT